MAFKPQPEENDRRKELAYRLKDIADELIPLVKAYEEVLQITETLVEAILSRLRAEFDAKSRNWQDSDAGAAAGELIDAWENIDLSSPVPNDFNHNTLLENIQTETIK